MKTLLDVKTRLLKNKATREAYLALEDEFSVAQELIAARVKAGLTQADVAARMGTTQSVMRAWKADGRCPRCAPFRGMRMPLGVAHRPSLLRG